jgi:hypothetical protein
MHVLCVVCKPFVSNTRQVTTHPALNCGYYQQAMGSSLRTSNLRLTECTFQGMKTQTRRAWAEQLNIPTDLRRILAEPYDLGLLLLGDSYLEACALDASVCLGGPTLLFCGQRQATKLPSVTNLRAIVLSNTEAKRFSCGLVGLKGELASRLIERLASEPRQIDVWGNPEIDVLATLDGVPQPKRQRARETRPNALVDQVVHLPTSWRQKPHRQKLSYFIPEWDDLVDPDYDFETDTHAGGSGDWSNEVYAHQMYPEPNYDGILVSKVVAEKSKKKKERINRLGVHRYLRLPSQFPIMGDCGAFGYIMDDTPPYTTDEILDYYTTLGFNYGVSIDNLIVTATEHQKRERYQLTIQNAENFLLEHRKRGLQWEPIGAVQGWDPKSYADAARQYVAMGYTYIGLGGLVRTPTSQILEILDRVHPYVPKDVAIHLFGLARINALTAFSQHGVRSVDSASFLRRAWMGTGQNYLTPDGELYAALRIPEADKSFRAKRMVSEGRASLEQVRALEQACLRAMREFDGGKLSVDRALDVLLEYDRLITPDRPDNHQTLRRTLEVQPWKTCPCAICQKDGIQVIIFRGNNRNRRRGFHNTYVFYRIVNTFAI